MKIFQKLKQTPEARFIFFRAPGDIDPSDEKTIRERMKKRQAEAQRLIHEEELRNHGDDGHQVIQILNQVEDHANNPEREQPHISFSLTKGELWVLTKSQRYKALQNLFRITHEIIEGEVDHIVHFTVVRKI